MSCWLLSNQIQVELTAEAEGFAGEVATEGAVAEARSDHRSAGTLAKQALEASVLCKRY